MPAQKPPQPRTAWTRAAVDLLDDGAWHDYEDIIGVMRRTIPTEFAVHTLNDRGKRTDSLAADVGRGQRAVATEALRNLERGNHLERKVLRDGGVQLRRRWS